MSKTITVHDQVSIVQRWHRLKAAVRELVRPGYPRRGPDDDVHMGETVVVVLERDDGDERTKRQTARRWR